MPFSNYSTLNNPMHFELADMLYLLFSNKRLYALCLYIYMIPALVSLELRF